MDAVQTTIKKITFFLATALLLTAPFHASAQPTLGATSTSVVIGSSSCNDFQQVTVTSSDGSNQAFTVAIVYPSPDPYSNWLYVRDANSDSTSTGTSFTTTTGSTGAVLTIGLNISIASATPQTTVQITPINGSAPVNITVFYTQNTSCGGNTGSTSNGFFSVTPGNVSLTAATNGQQSQNLTIQNTTGSAFSFEYSVSPAGSWLSASAASLTLSSDGTAILSVTGDATKTNGVGTYTGVVTVESQQSGFGNPVQIPVNFTVTNGTTTGGGSGNTGGTLTVGGSTNNTDIVNFYYVAPTPPPDQCIAIQDTSSNASYYSAAVSTGNGTSWLLANNSVSGTTNGSISPGANACVDLRLSNALSQLSSGAYQATVALTSSSGATATISVNLYISAGVAPGITVTSPNNSSPIYIFPNVAANSAVVQQAVFTLSAQSGYVLGTALLSSSSYGFSMSTPIANNNAETFTITSNSTGLTTGVYATTVTMTSSLGSSTNTTTLTIVLPVGQGGATTGTGGTTTSAVAPLSLAFQQQSGSSFWTSGREAQAITITGASGTQWSANIVYGSGSDWLNFDSPANGQGTFGSNPATLMVDLFNGVSSLTPSSTPYQATIDIVTPSGTTSVAVTLLVTASNNPVLLGLPSSSVFSATTGTNTADQFVTVVGSDNTGSSTSPPITAGSPTQSWITATTGGNTLTLAVNAGSLATGVYSGMVPVSAGAYSNPIQFPVTLVVNGGGGGTGTGTSGPLSLNPTSVSFSGVTVQSSQNLSVTASTSTQFTAVSSETTCTSNTWLQITSGSFTASSTVTSITVTVFPSGISNGTTCNGVITLQSSTGVQTVPVQMTVGTTSTGGSGNVTVTPTTMSFSYTQNQTVPAAQTATIVNAISGTASIPFTVATAETNGTSTNWLQASVANASTPYNSPGLSVSVAPGSLAAGTYTGTVTINPTGGNNVTISVTLTVIGVPVVTASPTTLSLTYLVGGASPTATINVSGGGSAANFTASAVSSLGWLQVSPTSGTTPNTGTFNLNVSLVSTVLTSLLPSGTPYTGTITITGTSPATGTTIVNVSLLVSAPLPVITGVTNAASGASGSVSPGELITIYGNPSNPLGPATAVQLNSTTCPSPCTSVPRSMGNVQVKFLPDGVFAPLIFVNQGQINAVVPYEVAGIASLSIEVLYLGQSSNAWPVNLAATAPGLFTSNASGTGQAVAEQYDNLGNYQPNVNSPSFPAKVGWTLVLYMTGEGVVSPAATTGSVTTNPGAPLVQPHVLIGNQPATVAYYGELPNVVSGVLQLNVVVPAGAGTGPVPISISLGSSSTQANVTVFLQ